MAVTKILASIGEGGMGQVYRARDTKLNRDVALKYDGKQDRAEEIGQRSD